MKRRVNLLPLSASPVCVFSTLIFRPLSEFEREVIHVHELPSTRVVLIYT
jgi:hypothetical protein